MPSRSRIFQVFRPSLVAFALAGTLLFSAGGALPSIAPSTRPALDSHHLDLLHELETGTWRQRRSAQEELVALGITETPIIGAMLAHTNNPDTQARLLSVLKQLDDVRHVGTSRITMHYHNATAKAVYASLLNQAGAPLKTQPTNLLDSLPPISIDADREPFWSVMQRLGKITNIGMDRPLGVWSLCRGNMVMRGPQAINGAFLFVLDRAVHTVRGNMAGNAEKCIRLDFAIYPEPKLNVQTIDQQVDIIRATDDHGNILQELAGQSMVQNNDPAGGFTLSIFLQLPDKNPGTRLANFHGTLKASVALQFARFDIPELTTAKIQTVDVNGLTLKFTGCKKVQSRYEVAFETGPDPRNEFQRIMESASTIRVIDTKGHDMQCSGSSTSQNLMVGNAAAYSFGAQVGDAVPQRLVWEIPTAVRTLDIPVDFHDLKLDAPGEPDQVDPQDADIEKN